LRGGILDGYAAQANPQIDTAREKKDHSRIEAIWVYRGYNATGQKKSTNYWPLKLEGFFLVFYVLFVKKHKGSNGIQRKGV
jgi:hypothetical protein